MSGMNMENLAVLSVTLGQPYEDREEAVVEVEQEEEKKSAKKMGKFRARARSVSPWNAFRKKKEKTPDTDVRIGASLVFGERLFDLYIVFLLLLGTRPIHHGRSVGHTGGI